MLTEMTNVVGAAFLGVTLGCARCHDHKFDPIRQSDYYRIQAYFAAAYDKDVVKATRRASGMEGQSRADRAGNESDHRCDEAIAGQTGRCSSIKKNR